jgi:hypothetical protein
VARLGSGMNASPMTYAVNGKQFSAIASGACCVRPSGQIANLSFRQGQVLATDRSMPPHARPDGAGNGGPGGRSCREPKPGPTHGREHEGWRATARAQHSTRLLPDGMKLWS